ncbi:histone H1-like [Pristis pectinata]|uniref:histone H1-like n=1 Tax=Pristis pectinata TaxID=685728 RepID=UPI00223DA8BF|nr:histone H1-like [Pristis pectinata]
MADTETAATDLSSATASPPPPPPPPPPDEAEVLDIAVAVKKKRRPYRHKKFGCTVAEQIMKAVAATKERRGLSVAAMKKMLSASGYNLARNNSRVNRAVRSLVSKGSLVQTAGSGASGSVRLGGSLEETAPAGRMPSSAATRRAALARRRAARKPRRLRSRGRKRRRHRLKRAGRNRRKSGALRKATHWKAARVKRALASGRSSRRVKAAAMSAPHSVNPTDLVDQKPTLSKTVEPDKS